MEKPIKTMTEKRTKLLRVPVIADVSEAYSDEVQVLVG